VEINHHVRKFEITMCNSLFMQELDSFEKLPAENGSQGHGKCIIVAERFLLWHGDNGVALGGKNDVE